MRFSAFFLAVVMVASGTTFALAQQARYIFNPNFLYYGENRSGQLPAPLSVFKATTGQEPFTSTQANGGCTSSSTMAKLFVTALAWVAMGTVGRALSASVRSGNGPTGFRQRKCLLGVRTCRVSCRVASRIPWGHEPCILDRHSIAFMARTSRGRSARRFLPVAFA